MPQDLRMTPANEQPLCYKLYTSSLPVVVIGNSGNSVNSGLISDYSLELQVHLRPLSQLAQVRTHEIWSLAKQHFTSLSGFIPSQSSTMSVWVWPVGMQSSVLDTACWIIKTKRTRVNMFSLESWLNLPIR